MTESERSNDATVAEHAPMVSVDPFGLGPGDMVDRYRIIQSIGVGGMGVVYRAHDPKLDREVAVKLVRADLLADRGQSQARLLREAQAMAQSPTPTYCPSTTWALSTRGCSLRWSMSRGKTCPSGITGGTTSPEQIVDVFIEAGRGLAAVHAAG